MPLDKEDLERLTEIQNAVRHLNHELMLAAKQGLVMEIEVFNRYSSPPVKAVIIKVVRQIS